MVNSGIGRAGGGCPSRGSDARISGRWTGPSSSARLSILVLVSLDFLDDPIVLRSERHLHLGVVRVLVVVDRGVLDRLRTAANVDVVTMFVGRRRCGRVGGHALGRARSNLRIQRRRRVRFAALARHLRVLVFVLGVARRAARLLHVVADHRDDGVVRHPPLARAVIVQNVTKPKLALLHPNSPKDPMAGEEVPKGGRNLSRAGFAVAIAPTLRPYNPCNQP